MTSAPSNTSFTDFSDGRSTHLFIQPLTFRPAKNVNHDKIENIHKNFRPIFRESAVFQKTELPVFMLPNALLKVLNSTGSCILFPYFTE